MTALLRGGLTSLPPPFHWGIPSTVTNCQYGSCLANGSTKVLTTKGFLESIEIRKIKIHVTEQSLLLGPPPAQTCRSFSCVLCFIDFDLQI